MLHTRPELPELLARHFGPSIASPIEHWPAEKLRVYQLEAIADQLRHVYANNPFYRHKFDAAGLTPAALQTLGDLRRFPLTTKDELRGDPWILLSVPKEDLALAHTSTGTTGGAWSYILYTLEDMYVRDLAPYLTVLMPVRDSDDVVNALPYEMSSSGQSFQRSLEGGAGALVVPVGKGGFYSDPYKTVRIMADLHADVLVTTPPYAMLLAEVADDLRLRPGKDICLRFMWITGEGCSPAYRRRLEEMWHCPALIFYGSMECGSIAVECPQKSGSHLCLGHVYVEILDPKTAEPLPPGQVGEVVCTVLQRKASPLIRFRTQDLGLLDESPCPCGVKLPRLHIRGRLADHVTIEAQDRPASQVSPYMIEEVLYSQAEMGHNYQVYTAGEKLVIDAEPRTTGADLSAARARILDVLRQRGLQAELNWIDHVPRVGGKTRRIRPIEDREQVMSAPSLLQRSRRTAQ